MRERRFMISNGKDNNAPHRSKDSGSQVIPVNGGMG